MGSTLAASRPARIRDKYGREPATVADVAARSPRGTETAGGPEHGDRRREHHRARRRASLDDEQLDARPVVARSRAARTPSGGIDDQEAVDRIVWAMVVAGLEHAVELAELAMEETGFGVLRGQGGQELHRHRVPLRLPEGQALGRRDRGGRRARRSSYVAEPIGVVLALLPITNPTSTALFKAIVAAKTRNAIIFRPSARAARCATRADRDPPGGRRGAPGLPPDALQVIPDPTLDVSQYLFHHPGVDFIWTTGGPKAVAAANAAGKPCISVGAGQRARLPAPQRRRADGRRRHADLQDVRRVGDLPGRADAASSTTPIYDAIVAELERMGARRARRRARSTRSPPSRSTTTAAPRSDALGQSCADLGALAGFAAGDRRQGARSRRCPSDLDALAAHPLAAREADAGARARALAVGRARARASASSSPSTAASATPRRSTRPTRP